MAISHTIGPVRLYVKYTHEPDPVWYELGEAGFVRIAALGEIPINVPFVGPRIEESILIAARVRSYLCPQ